MPSSVREDRDGGAHGAPAVAPAARPGSRAPCGEALNASKREAAPKMRPDGPAGEHGVDRAQAQAARAVKPSATNRPDLPIPCSPVWRGWLLTKNESSPQETCPKENAPAAMGRGKRPLPYRTRKLRRAPPRVPRRNGAGEKVAAGAISDIYICRRGQIGLRHLATNQKIAGSSPAVCIFTISFSFFLKIMYFYKTWLNIWK